MPTLILEFPAGRYHATPWGHHVNEGLIEWPPSPWRLLRALLASGYTALHWQTGAPPTDACRLIEKLASTLPTYRLPQATGAHSRHYMPLAALEKGREKTTLVFDTWARIEGMLSVTWDVVLTTAELDVLTLLVARLGYLGRSESWVVGRLATREEETAGIPCWPERDTEQPGPGWEQVPLIAPVSAEDYAQWRQQEIDRIEASLPQPKQGKPPSAKLEKQRKQAISPYPLDLISCLQMKTSDLHSYGWSQPPGSRRVYYWRPANSLGVEAAVPRRTMTVQKVEAVLLALSSQRGGNHILPNIARTLPLAERLHKLFVGHLNGRNNPALTGRDNERKPLREPHRHGHILPLDLDGDDHLDHFLIWAPMGLDGMAQAAIRATRRTFAEGVPGPLRLTWAGSGRLEDLRRLRGAWGLGLHPVLESCSEWVSCTPFVPPRHLKRKGPHSLEGQVRKELSVRSLPEPVDIRILPPHEQDLARNQRHFIRGRLFGPPPPIDCGFSLRILFPKAIPGPICIGYGSHFGMGLFRAWAGE